jgi:hypothetical protein
MAAREQFRLRSRAVHPDFNGTARDATRPILA